MKTTTMTSKIKFGPVFWALLWGFHLTAGALSPAWAQRRRAEPEANPQFQDQLKGGGEPGSGGPVGGASEASESESGGESEDSSMSGSSFPQRPSESPLQRQVQIGASGAPKAPPAPPTNPLDTRIVVRVKNAPLSTFLDTISAQAKVNFIITEGLEDKRVTAFLQNVTVREALQILLEIKGLTYQRIGKSNTYVVSPRAKGVPNRITRIYALNYIPLVDVSGAKTDFSPTKSGGDEGGGGGGGEAGGEGGAPAEGGSMGGGSGPQGGGGDKGGVAIISVLKSVLSRQYGAIAVDARTNSIIITDIPETFPQVEQILAELDRKAPQVMIEAQIVEINSDRANQLGLEWGGTNGELASYTAGLRDTQFPFNIGSKLGQTRIFDPVSSLVSGVGASAGGSSDSSSSGSDSDGGSSQADVSVGSNLQTGVVDLTSLTVILRALVARAEARFLGKPKILTLNNQQAVIQITRSSAVALESKTTGGTAGITSSGSGAERFTTGLTLNVTPQVNREGYITMLVQPQFTNVVESPISSQSQRVFDPLSRAASTLVRVKNGQTLVLGGLLESKETKQVRKVPFLGYIPLIGWLFTSVSNQRQNTDLVIFITPTIIYD